MILVLDPWERYEIPAAVHDLLYRVQKASRASADSFFRELMLYQGVPFVPRNLIYLAVRVFGHRAWQENRAQGILGSYQAEQQIAELDFAGEQSDIGGLA